MIRKLIILIISFLSLLLIIFSVFKFKEINELKYYNNNEQEMIEAALNYFRYYSNYLPKTKEDKKIVLLEALIKKKYILNDVVDINNKKCNYIKSYVEVSKVSDVDYIYKAHLVCDDYETKDGD